MNVSVIVAEKLICFFLYILSLGAKCPEGWTLAGSSCYFLSTEIISTFNEAVTFCENLGSTLVEVNHVCFFNLADSESLFNQSNS